MPRHAEGISSVYLARRPAAVRVPEDEVRRGWPSIEEQADKNPRKRGPKRKAVTPSASVPRRTMTSPMRGASPRRVLR